MGAAILRVYTPIWTRLLAAPVLLCMFGFTDTGYLGEGCFQGHHAARNKGIVVALDSCNIRKTPSTALEPIGSIEKRKRYTIVSRKNGWTQIALPALPEPPPMVADAPSPRGTASSSSRTPHSGASGGAVVLGVLLLFGWVIGKVFGSSPATVTRAPASRRVACEACRLLDYARTARRRAVDHAQWKNQSIAEERRGVRLSREQIIYHSGEEGRQDAEADSFIAQAQAVGHAHGCPNA